MSPLFKDYARQNGMIWSLTREVPESVFNARIRKMSDEEDPQPVKMASTHLKPSAKTFDWLHEDLTDIDSTQKPNR